MKIVPFRAIRPVSDKVHLMASRSYVSYSSGALKRKLEENPYTFIHIINPEFGKKKRTPPNSVDRFRKVKEKFKSFLHKRDFVLEKSPCYYVYEQMANQKPYVGIIAGVSIEDYHLGKIKKHEATITERENTFKRYLEITGFNAEPVLLAQPENPGIDAIIASTINRQSPVYNFTTTDRIRHRLWTINDEEAIEEITQSFSSIEKLYIADGHHRSASSALHGLENSNDFSKFFMAYIVSENQLDILDFNRLVKDIGHHSEESFLEALHSDFVVHTCEEDPTPRQKHQLSMYFSGRWYWLYPKESIFDPNDSIDSLDAQILTKNILAPILGIEDLKTDKRIGFIGGKEGMEGIAKKVNKGDFKVGFALFPVAMDHLKKIADEEKIMPPKTTWIEPKLRSGLTIYAHNDYFE